MRIAFVASAASIHSYRWVSYFARAGHEVALLSLHPWAFERIEDVTFVRMGGSFAKWVPPALALSAYRVRRTVAKLKPDVVHAHSAGLYGVVAAVAGVHPLVLTAWGSDVLVAGRTALKGPAVRMALRKADLITCDAEHMRHAIAEMGVNAAKIARINFGTDLKFFKRHASRADLKERLGIVGSPVVVSTRDYRKIYNLEWLIKAVPAVLRRHRETKFVMVGGGPEEERLRALADSLGVSTSMRFVGRIPPNEMPEYLCAADIYVSTSRSDAGLAAGTAEAMACELPVIVTDFGDNREWVRNGENGFLVSSDDVVGLTEKISVLLDSERMRQEFGAQNRCVIAERNNFETEMKKMEDLYRRLVGAGDPRGSQ